MANDVDPLVRAVCAAQPRGHYFAFHQNTPFEKRSGTEWNICVRCGVLLHERNQEPYECQSYYVVYDARGLFDVVHKQDLTPPLNESIVTTLEGEEKGA